MADADCSGRGEIVPLFHLPRHGLLTAFGCAILVTLALTGCARPKGDFGRTKSSTIHDDVMPSMGTYSARRRGEPVSNFNLTNDERELRDRSWAIVGPPHAADWAADQKAEGQRTRLLGEVDRTLDPKTYYDYLRKDSYQSSDARYDRVINDMRSDKKLVDPFYVVLKRVLAADAERARVARASITATSEERRSAQARVDENIRLQNWVCRALRFRLQAYRNAVDRLEIETPSDRLFEVNLAWRRLDTAIDAAQKATAESFATTQQTVRPSRFASQWANEDKVPQK